MTNPPHDGDERDAGTGAPHADPDRNLTQPVQYEHPAPPPRPSGQPGSARPQPYPSADRPPGYGPPPHGQPPQYGQPPEYGQPPQYGQPPYAQPGQYGPGSQYPQPPWQPTPPPWQAGQPGQGQFGPPGYGEPYGQGGPGRPPYGAPWQPYGAVASGPARTSRGRLVGGIALAALLLLVGVVAAALALQSTVLDPAAVERDVAAQFEQREGVAIDLTCREEMEVEEGESYPCTGVTAKGEEITLQITITDEDSAAYTWTEP